MKVMLMKSSGRAVMYSILDVSFTVRMDTLGNVMSPISQFFPLYCVPVQSHVYSVVPTSVHAPECLQGFGSHGGITVYEQQSTMI